MDHLEDVVEDPPVDVPLPGRVGPLSRASPLSSGVGGATLRCIACRSCYRGTGVGFHGTRGLIYGVYELIADRVKDRKFRSGTGVYGTGHTRRTSDRVAEPDVWVSLRARLFPLLLVALSSAVRAGAGTGHDSTDPVYRKGKVFPTRPRVRTPTALYAAGTEQGVTQWPNVLEVRPRREPLLGYDGRGDRLPF